jgi:hypothetical protein
MDENEKLNIVLKQICDETVPDNFFESIDKKIDAQKMERAEKKETLLHALIAVALAIFFFAILYWLGNKYFNAGTIQDYIRPDLLKEYYNRFSELFMSPESGIWIITGINISLLSIAGIIISRRTNLKEENR